MSRRAFRWCRPGVLFSLFYHRRNGQRPDRRPFGGPDRVQEDFPRDPWPHGGLALLLLLYLDGGLGLFWRCAGRYFCFGYHAAWGGLGRSNLAPKGRSDGGQPDDGIRFRAGGAIVSPLVGKMADLYSIQSTLTVMSLLPACSPCPLIVAFSPQQVIGQPRIGR